jgi:tetratricopeptide (TPR) repeat protein
VNRNDEARAAVDAAIEANPDMAEARALSGALFAGKGRTSEAVKEYEQAVRLKPDFARAHLDLARLLANEGDMRGATLHLRQAAAGSDPEVAQLATEALQRTGK